MAAWRQIFECDIF